MSKYKVGDKVVMEITDKFKNAYGHEYYSILDSIYSTDFIDEKSEPLGNYTEPLERKNENKQKRIEKLVDRLHKQAAEITRLLAENKQLKAENGNVIWEIEQAFDRGCNAAWKMAKKIVRQPINGGYKQSEFEEIFGCGYISDIFEKYTYPAAAAKVEAWEKAKEEIKVGDVVKCEGSYGVITEIGTSTFSGIRKDSTVFHWYKVNCTKTGRHIDIDGFLKQIGGESNE